MFILFNVIMMLNLIIGIMATSYENYAEVAKGHYYDSLISIFALYDYHDTWGFITCAHLPLNFFLIL